MTKYFADVLATENAALAQVTDGAGMECWRRRVVSEVMDPDSPYASAIRQSTAGDAGREFLLAWRELLTWAVERVLQSKVAPEGGSTGGCRHDGTPDADRLTVLILAALHGGGTLSRVADDPAPLDAALDIALAALTAPPTSENPSFRPRTGQ